MSPTTIHRSNHHQALRVARSHPYLVGWLLVMLAAFVILWAATWGAIL